MDDETIRIAVGLRLGCDLITPHRCTCGAQVDATAHHGLSCRRSAGRHSRHSDINCIIHGALTSANISSTLEPVGLFRSDGKRPDGMSLQPWQRGKCLIWDATAKDTLAPSNVALSADKAGATARVGETAKRRNIAPPSILTSS